MLERKLSAFELGAAETKEPAAALRKISSVADYAHIPRLESQVSASSLFNNRGSIEQGLDQGLMMRAAPAALTKITSEATGLHTPATRSIAAPDLLSRSETSTPTKVGEILSG